MEDAVLVIFKRRLTRNKGEPKYVCLISGAINGIRRNEIDGMVTS